MLCLTVRRTAGGVWATGCRTSSRFSCPSGSGRHRPGPSSAPAVSGRRRWVAPLRCPLQHGTHHSYSGARSPNGRSSTQNACREKGERDEPDLEESILSKEVYSPHLKSFCCSIFQVLVHLFCESVDVIMQLRPTWRPPEEPALWLWCRPQSGSWSLWSERSGSSRQSAGLYLLIWHSNSRPGQKGGRIRETVCACVCVFVHGVPLILYLVWINNFFSEEGVFSCSTVKQAPVHAQIPDQCVEWADGGEHDQQVEEHVGVRMSLFWSKHTHATDYR